MFISVITKDARFIGGKNNEMVRTLWLQYLPSHIQQILSVCSVPLEELQTKLLTKGMKFHIIISRHQQLIISWILSVQNLSGANYCL